MTRERKPPKKKKEEKARCLKKEKKNKAIEKSRQPPKKRTWSFFSFFLFLKTMLLSCLEGLEMEILGWNLEIFFFFYDECDGIHEPDLEGVFFFFFFLFSPWLALSSRIFFFFVSVYWNQSGLPLFLFLGGFFCGKENSLDFFVYTIQLFYNKGNTCVVWFIWFRAQNCLLCNLLLFIV